MATMTLSPSSTASSISTSSTAVTSPSLYALSPTSTSTSASTPSFPKPILPKLRTQRDKIDVLNRRGAEQFSRALFSLARAKTRKVAVLLLSWAPVGGRTLKVAKEIEDLTTVFETRYNFRVHSKLLSSHTQPAPRYQLQSILHEFLLEYDKPGTLCVVYYGGHGVPSADEEELVLKSDHDDKIEPSMEEVHWSTVEPLLYRLSADLLLIFDCCYAGIIARSKRTWPDSKSHFEFIGSTTYDRGACGPDSRGSFTRALINALIELAGSEKVFTTSHLVRKIETYADFRYGGKQQPCLSECGKKNVFRRLKIMPLEPGQMDLQTPVEPPHSSTRNFYLHLKYVLTEEPTEENIATLVDRLTELIRNDRLPISSVMWAGLSKYDPHMRMPDAAKMLLATFGTRTGSALAKRFPNGVVSNPAARAPRRTLTELSMDDEEDTTLVSKTVIESRETSSSKVTQVRKVAFLEHAKHAARLRPNLKWSSSVWFMIFVVAIVSAFVAGSKVTLHLPAQVVGAKSRLIRQVVRYLGSLDTETCGELAS